MAGRLTKKRFFFALSVAFVLGALIWAMSPIIAGRIEAWDNEGGYYYLSLMAAGFIPALIVPGYFWLWPVFVFAGQQSYMLLLKGPESLLGIFFLGLYVKDCLLGAVGGAVFSKLGSGLMAAERAGERGIPATTGNKGVWLFLAIAAVLLAWSGISFSDSMASAYSFAIVSPKSYPYWINISNGLSLFLSVAPFILLSVKSWEYSRTSKVYERRGVSIKLLSLLTVLLPYIGYLYCPLSVKQFLSMPRLISIPFVPLFIHWANSLYSKLLVVRAE